MMGGRLWRWLTETPTGATVFGLLLVVVLVGAAMLFGEQLFMRRGW
jgi:hypothetical protein